jgi:diguanylate cyclase (GGDEF)-like protein/PAS domain S-box-containing protein
MKNHIKERHYDLLDNLPIGIYHSTPEGALKYVNLALAQMLGYSDRNSLLKENIASTYANPEDRRRWQKTIEREGGACDFELQLRRRDGTYIWVRDFARAIKDKKGRVLHYEGSLEDITQRKMAEEASRIISNRYRSYIELTEQLGWVTNAAGEVEEDIPSWRNYTGQAEEEVKGAGWSKALHPDDVGRTLEIWKKAVATKSPYETEYRIRRFDGIYRHFIARGVPVLNKADGTIQEWVGTCIDITERKRMEENLMIMSMTDPLTGLYNRRGFITLADQQLKLSKRTKKPLILFFADLDGMKKINDTLGHLEGDQALQEAARVLKASFRESDIIARIGGDEFAVLAIGTDGMEPEIIKARLLKSIDIHNSRQTRQYKISLSLGICRYDPGEDYSLDRLMTEADQAMYEEKRHKL